jgi:hypothetical protein
MDPAPCAEASVSAGHLTLKLGVPHPTAFVNLPLLVNPCLAHACWKLLASGSIEHGKRSNAAEQTSRVTSALTGAGKVSCDGDTCVSCDFLDDLKIRLATWRQDACKWRRLHRSSSLRMIIVAPHGVKSFAQLSDKCNSYCDTCTSGIPQVASGIYNSPNLTMCNVNVHERGTTVCMIYLQQHMMLVCAGGVARWCRECKHAHTGPQLLMLV